MYETAWGVSHHTCLEFVESPSVTTRGSRSRMTPLTASLRYAASRSICGPRAVRCAVRGRPPPYVIPGGAARTRLALRDEARAECARRCCLRGETEGEGQRGRVAPESAPAHRNSSPTTFAAGAPRGPLQSVYSPGEATGRSHRGAQSCFPFCGRLTGGT